MLTGQRLTEEEELAPDVIQQLLFLYEDSVSLLTKVFVTGVSC